MSDLVVSQNRIPAMSNAQIDKVQQFQDELMQLPQAQLETQHVIHGGMYARTIKLQAGHALAGALIKVPTMLIVNGHAMISVGDDSTELYGHNVLAGSGMRKQAFYAYADTWLTMIYVTDATTVEDAESGFTDEADTLMSRQPASKNVITITGE